MSKENEEYTVLTARLQVVEAERNALAEEVKLLQGVLQEIADIVQNDWINLDQLHKEDPDYPGGCWVEQAAIEDALMDTKTNK